MSSLKYINKTFFFSIMTIEFEMLLHNKMMYISIYVMLFSFNFFSSSVFQSNTRRMYVSYFHCVYKCYVYVKRIFSLFDLCQLKTNKDKRRTDEDKKNCTILILICEKMSKNKTQSIYHSFICVQCVCIFSFRNFSFFTISFWPPFELVQFT